MGSWEYAEIRRSGVAVWWWSAGEDRRLPGANPFEHLDSAGREGWELVAVTEATSGLFGGDRVVRYTLKRPVPNS